MRRAVVVALVVALAVACTPPPAGPRLAAGLTVAPPGAPATSVAGFLRFAGYDEAEYFLSGTASSYRARGRCRAIGHARDHRLFGAVFGKTGNVHGGIRIAGRRCGNAGGEGARVGSRLQRASGDRRGF